MSKKKAVIDKACVACGNCAQFCPLSAIRIDSGVRAKVSEKCVGCGKCATACPAGVIKIVALEDE